MIDFVRLSLLFPYLTYAICHEYSLLQDSILFWFGVFWIIEVFYFFFFYHQICLSFPWKL